MISPECITPRARWMSLAAFSLMLLLAGARPARSADPALGETRYVSCQRLPLHAAASAYSSVVATLSYGAGVKILAIAVPAAPAAPAGGKASAAPAKVAAPLWAKVQAGAEQGYVPLSSLVSAALLARQNSKTASDRARSQAGGQGINCRFSETENKPDLKAMKGAGGEARGGQANYRAIDLILQTRAGSDPRQPQNTAFRQQGRLAEFKK